MDFAFTKKEEKLIQEVRQFLKENVTPALLAEVRQFGPVYGGPKAREFGRALGSRGWIAPHWPREYGGLGASEISSCIVRDELSYALGFGFNIIGAHMAGPVILRFGSEEMKEKYLRPIARGEIEFSLGYTEPDAGSDLMNLRMRAEDKGDFFLVNGNKTFSSSAYVVDYHWLAVRTDPDAPKHKGISLLIVDLKTPGITINPMMTLGGYRTTEVFYDDVKVPKKNLVGEINKGAYYLGAALSFERLFPPSVYRRLYEDVLAYSKETFVNGRPLSENPLVRQKLAQVAIELEVARLLFYRGAYMVEKGEIPDSESSMEKFFVSEMDQRIASTCMDILSPYGVLKEGSKWAQLNGSAERYYRWSVVETIYGGTSEIMRNIMALRGLRLPRH